MIEKIEEVRKQAELLRTDSQLKAEDFRLTFLSRKGLFNEMLDAFKLLSPEQKREAGKHINELKVFLEQVYAELQSKVISDQDETVNYDYSLPSDYWQRGSRHPLSKVRDRICEIFERIGYTIAEGPEIEDDYHNFTALNFPPNHPARDMQDTFFVKGNQPSDEFVLRTHTSSVQVRMMEQQQPPIRMIMPGRVYRNEAISARAHCFFHQIEGLYIDKHVSFADLKQTLLFFAREVFGKEAGIRLRPSYFPFTEPSFEVDVSCSLCGGKGCNVCKHTGWLEILGCGMVDPNVLENCGIDPNEYSGFAFGMGVERITQLLYKVPDLRLYSENDIRFLQQFSAEI